MNKVWLIISREMRMRLRKPSFWLVTLLVPVVLAVLYALPVIAAQRADRTATVLVVDETGLFESGFRSTPEVRFHRMPSLEYAASHRSADENLVLYIPRHETYMPREATLFYYDYRAPSLDIQSTVDNQLQLLLRNAIMEDVYGLTPAERHSVESSHITLHTRDVVTGHDGFTRVKTVVAMVLAVLMALALVGSGVQVMRAVQEERQNRVAEVVATSVRPVQLMSGKVAGVAVTMLLQLVLWLSLTSVAIIAIQSAVPDLFEAAREQAAMRAVATKGAVASMQYDTPATLVDDTISGLAAINLPLIAVAFLVAFLLGFLLYGGLLAALAARLDSEADALQWTLLVCSPLLVALLLVPLLRGSPLLILIPFTAPVAVISELPFGISIGTVLFAALLLLLLGSAALLLAARTYRRKIV